MSIEEEIGVGNVDIEVHMDPGNAGSGTGSRYSRDELFAIYWGMGDSYYSWVGQVCAVLEPVSQELYEMDASHSSLKPRHKTIDKRQRAKKAKAPSLDSDVTFSDEEIMLELGLDLPNHFIPTFSEPEVYEDSEEEIESFQPLAFAVEGEPDFESGEPQDGWEYLRRVKWEFARCPKVKVAEIDPKKLADQTPYMPSIPSVSACSPHLLPAKEWEIEFLADFSNLRMRYAESIVEERKYTGSLPSIHNQVGWEIFCFGKLTSLVEEEATTSLEDNLKSSEGVIEETSEGQFKSVDEVSVEEVKTETNKDADILLPNLDSETEFPALGINATSSDDELHSSHVPDSSTQKDAIQDSTLIIERIKTGLKDSAKRKSSDLKGPNPPLLGILMKLDEVKRAALLRYHIAWLERMDCLSEGRSQWLFALSVVVDKPLDAQTMAAYRALLRWCAALRSSKISAEDEELHRVNILITIAGRYFGQSEDALT